MENNPNTIKEQVMSRIAEEKVTPRSKWYFTARHAALWTPGIVVTAVGAFAIAGLLFSATHAGWEYRPLTRFSLLEFVVEVIPVIWLVSLALFGILIVKSLRLTAKGYRYKTGIILTSSFVVSLLLGTGLFALDMTVKRNGLIRFGVERAQTMLWNAPSDGRITGVIDIDGMVVTLTGNDGEVWTLDTSELVDEPLITDDGVVRIIGIETGDHVFLSCIIMPWELGPRSPQNNERPGDTRPRLKERVASLSERCETIVKQSRPRPSERNIPPQP